ncbi:restriction endonuclease subunit S [Marinobacter sp. TBZ242]|uniref:Restriction endonuclease subunit S n=1 Tax=Marinobacter azerbaijanicus TaxID=3050455 RepID=A0ABT7IHQ6_9GAMM|nr:restriction endonuclease subunit S [Marinobacter sp. TBZ242]MDL0433717.1 restriction endonuclease subunit S [Marinobacter sp. TBZ242]
MSAQELITDHLDLWTGAVTHKSGTGRGASGKNGKIELTGIKKLRELILELAVRGKLVKQDPSDEPASVLLEKIAEEKARLVEEGKVRKPKKLKEKPGGYTAPFDIPDNWKWSPVDQLAPFPLFDGDWIESKDQDPTGSIRLLQLADIGVGEFKNTSRKYINSETFARLKCSRINAGDILIARLPSPIGRATVFPGLMQDCITAVDVAILRTEEMLNQQYVVHALNSTTCRNQVESYGKGATRFRISTGNLKTILIPVPPLPEQHRIVEKVDELMALCDRLEQEVGDQLEAHEVLVDTLLDALTHSTDAAELAENWARVAEHFDTLFTTEASIDKLKKAILQLAVMGRLVPQSLNDKHASALLDEILAERDRLKREEGMKTKASGAVNTEEAYLTIPRSWVWVRLGNTAKFIDYRGKTPKKVGSGKRLITAKNIRKGYIDKDPEEFISEPDYHTWMTRGFPRVGDTLFTPEAPLGNAANVDLEEEFALAQRAICFQWHVREISPFMLMQILALPFQEQLIFNATGMTATGIKAAKLKEIPVVLPPLEEQKSIVEKVEELMALCDRLKVRLGEAGETRAQLAETVVEQAVN